MAEFPALPLWTDSYLSDTMDLTLEQHGAYLKLLMIAWRDNDCSLPADDARIARMLGITNRKWGTLRAHIIPFWTLEDGRFYQKKLTICREKVKDIKEKRVAAGIKSAEVKALKTNNAVPTHVADVLQQNPQHPINTSQASKTKTINTETPSTTTETHTEPNPFETNPTHNEDVVNEKKAEKLDSKYNPNLGQVTVQDAARQLMRQRAAEVTPPNLLWERETIINQFMTFHISRENAEALHDGARKMLERKELAEIIGDIKAQNGTREQLQKTIGEAVVRKQEESQKIMHNPSVQIQYMQAWGRLAHKLRGEKGEQEYQMWIKPVRVEEASDHNLTLRCSKSVANQIQNSELKKRIIDLWKIHTNDEITLQFVE